MPELHLLNQHNSLSTRTPCYSATPARRALPQHCLGVRNAAQIKYKEARCRGQLIGAIASSKAAVQPLEEPLSRSQSTSQPVPEVDKGNGIVEGGFCQTRTQIALRILLRL